MTRRTLLVDLPDSDEELGPNYDALEGLARRVNQDIEDGFSVEKLEVKSQSPTRVRLIVHLKD